MPAAPVLPGVATAREVGLQASQVGPRREGLRWEGPRWEEPQRAGPHSEERRTPVEGWAMPVEGLPAAGRVAERRPGAAAVPVPQAASAAHPMADHLTTNSFGHRSAAR